MEEWVALSLDGKIFRTLRDTLCQDPNSLLYTMFHDPTSDTAKMLTRDDSHPLRPFLLDRNPKAFRVVLEFLRNQELVIPEDVPARSVLLEARFFGIQKIMDQLSGTEPQFEGAKGSMFTRMDMIRMLSATQSGSRVRLQGVVLDRTDLSNLDLSGINFSHSSLNNVSFENTNLSGADLSDCKMSNVNMVNAMLDGADLSRSTLTNADLSQSSVCRANLSDAVLHQCCLRNSRMNESILVRTDLSQSDMKGVSLNKAKLWQVNLDGVERQGTPLTMGGVLA
jgi:uncharacterized protein YjbI with pentapeptide repeats